MQQLLRRSIYWRPRKRNHHWNPLLSSTNNNQMGWARTKTRKKNQQQNKTIASNADWIYQFVIWKIPQFLFNLSLSWACSSTYRNQIKFNVEKKVHYCKVKLICYAWKSIEEYVPTEEINEIDAFFLDVFRTKHRKTAKKTLFGPPELPISSPQKTAVRTQKIPTP